VEREARGVLRRVVEQELPQLISMLANDVPLPSRFCDHPLTGKWADHRDCHLRPDLVLIYRKSEPNLLTLARFGSHSELKF